MRKYILLIVVLAVARATDRQAAEVWAPLAPYFLLPFVLLAPVLAVRAIDQAQRS